MRKSAAAKVATVTTRITRSSTVRDEARIDLKQETAIEAKVEIPAEDDSPKPKRRKVNRLSESSPPSQASSNPTFTPASFSLPKAISHLTCVDARFGPLFARLPCRPFLGEYQPVDPFHTLVKSIIGQQVSWMAARAINRRFRALYGHHDDETDGFPTPAEVASSEISELKSAGLSTRKAEYVVTLAEHFLDGRLSAQLLYEGSDEDVARALIAVRGIGQWTVDMFLIFSLRRPDVLPVGDLGVQKGLLRWALSAHGALPVKAPRTPKSPKTPTKSVAGTLTTSTPIREVTAPVSRTPGPPTTPFTSMINAATPTPATPGTPTRGPPSTPTVAQPTPGANLEAPTPTLPPRAPDSLLSPPLEWDSSHAERAAPLNDGLTLAVLRQRLAGKKVKGGAYLLPSEMEALTEAWRPYRSLGVYYTWSVAEESS